MLLSMTGHGEGRHENDALAAAVEIRTINNRYLKLSLRCNENYTALEGHVERAVKKQVKRGTVQVQIQVTRKRHVEDYCINGDVLESYRKQIDKLQSQWHLSDAIPLEAMLALPGVIEEGAGVGAELEDDWPVIEQALGEALSNLTTMRTTEGEELAEDLRANAQTIAAELDQIEARLPDLADEYRQRLVERVNRTLENHDIRLEPADVIREVSLYAERSDVSEEIVRLRSHLKQFDVHLRSAESTGRKLDFVTQEMFREANTIGSKSSDTVVPPHVVEIKAAIERMREQVQNVE
ncbi:MAG: YicC family protein [Planctomycetales bacterium]|nr:YicC family protein [Planctomycetales bacterium]